MEEKRVYEWVKINNEFVKFLEQFISKFVFNKILFHSRFLSPDPAPTLDEEMIRTVTLQDVFFSFNFFLSLNISFNKNIGENKTIQFKISFFLNLSRGSSICLNPTFSSIILSLLKIPLHKQFNFKEILLLVKQQLICFLKLISTTEAFSRASFCGYSFNSFHSRIYKPAEKLGLNHLGHILKSNIYRNIIENLKKGCNFRKIFRTFKRRYLLWKGAYFNIHLISLNRSYHYPLFFHSCFNPGHSYSLSSLLTPFKTLEITKGKTQSKKGHM
uniref:Uncharacterized protein n=1 Tax=Heterorhabditis bacteriophora TaxID=37862 RepID=A0A1I7WIH4_HETBA